MTINLFMLSAILAIVIASSFIASLIPGKPIPEVVFFVFAGAVAGPYCLGIIHSTEAMEMLSHLGLGMLFLLAGYELNPKDLMGARGRHASISWVVSMVLAVVVTPLMGLGLDSVGSLAFAIALTTTAYGTLVPIMRERQLVGTPTGDVIDSYGAIGEILPVLAMSVLLIPSRPKVASVIYLLIFVGICLVVAHYANAVKRYGRRFVSWVVEYAGSSSQPMVRITMLLLVSLLLLAATMELDAVLGAFAAGFILRYVVGDDDALISKLQVIGNSFFIPLFFVVSGMGVNLMAAVEDPGLLVAYMLLLLLVRGCVVGVSLYVFPETRSMSLGEKVSASLYCTMALPLIVALTEVATDAGAMGSELASVLVTAGALTVLIIPVVTTATRTVISVHPIEAAQQIRVHPDDVREIVHEHMELRHDMSEQFYKQRRRQKELGKRFSSADYLALSRAMHARFYEEHHPDAASHTPSDTPAYTPSTSDKDKS